MWEVAWDAPIEKCRDVFESVARFALGFDYIYRLGNVAMRDLVEGFSPVEVAVEGADRLVSGTRPPLALIEILLTGFGDGGCVKSI